MNNTNDDSVMLSTLDNPYDPFTQYDEWFVFDTEHGYNCCSLLARVSQFSIEFDEQKEKEIVNEAIDKIIKMNLNGKFIKVFKNSFIKPVDR